MLWHRMVRAYGACCVTLHLIGVSPPAPGLLMKHRVACDVLVWELKASCHFQCLVLFRSGFGRALMFFVCGLQMQGHLKQYGPSVFPPSPEEVAYMNLDRWCVTL